ncbi:zinc finger protein 92-like isoform X2 [Trichogramma pretiosum]|uniref:zinc finger protein 92-like isoform X1 n=1 Tax=Trichogramma pretiosum TaxID=7493 RepID=UPI000C71C01A|nr:zinc finger protein 92-like isoform X1 [Trichogramma pretiosum]XP_023313249.1 zinc finger protein 92-like isoform X2 [Trichogramma pretiosum]
MADSRKYPCKSCPRVFSSERELGCHLEIHSGTLTCRLGCHRNFSSATEMEKHLKLVHFDIWTCDGCGKDFYKELDWVVHTRKVHLTMKNYPNKDHIEAYLPKNVLSNNHATVNEIIINLACEYCDKNFNTIDDLKRHKDVVHLKEKSYDCVKCKKTFSSEKYLRAHTTAMHTKEKKFKCEKCQKCFVYQSYLAKHAEKHIAWNQRLKYKCEECNTKFISVDNLKRHLGKQHSKVQEYICQKPKVPMQRM